MTLSLIPESARRAFSPAQHAARFVSAASQIAEYVRDMRRERRIRRLQARLSIAFRASDLLSVEHVAGQLFAEIGQRSPAQRARLRSRAFAQLDPHVRAGLGL